MSNNKLNIKHIASFDYFELIKDCATSQYYNWKLPDFGAHKSNSEFYNGTTCWHSEYVDDPIDRLLIAVIRQAVNDYIALYKKHMRHPSIATLREMQILEHDFFDRNEITKAIFDHMIEKLKNKQYHFLRIIVKEDI